MLGCSISLCLPTHPQRYPHVIYAHFTRHTCHMHGTQYTYYTHHTYGHTHSHAHPHTCVHIKPHTHTPHIHCIHAQIHHTSMYVTHTQISQCMWSQAWRTHREGCSLPGKVDRFPSCLARLQKATLCCRPPSAWVQASHPLTLPGGGDPACSGSPQAPQALSTALCTKNTFSKWM